MKGGKRRDARGGGGIRAETRANGRGERQSEESVGFVDD